MNSFPWNFLRDLRIKIKHNSLFFHQIGMPFTCNETFEIEEHDDIFGGLDSLVELTELPESKKRKFSPESYYSPESEYDNPPLGSGENKAIKQKNNIGGFIPIQKYFASTKNNGIISLKTSFVHRPENHINPKLEYNCCVCTTEDLDPSLDEYLEETIFYYSLDYKRNKKLFREKHVRIVKKKLFNF
jgi:hypothetical protein